MELFLAQWLTILGIVFVTTTLKLETVNLMQNAFGSAILNVFLKDQFIYNILPNLS